MRYIIALLICSCIAVSGNPLPMPLENSVFISSERLEVKLAPMEAVINATFTFASNAPTELDEHSPTSIDLPIWLPYQNASNALVAAFWETFGTNMFNRITPERRTVFDKAVGLKVLVEKREIPVDAFAAIYKKGFGGRIPIFKRKEWQVFDRTLEPGFCCLLFEIAQIDEIVSKHTPVTVSYRQPLGRINGNGQFFYLPIFGNLPSGISTADTNRYSVAITAAPNCALTVTSGGQTFAVEPSHIITISPKHLEPIRAKTMLR